MKEKKTKTDENTKNLPTHKDLWTIGDRGHSCQTSLRQRRIPQCVPSCELI